VLFNKIDLFREKLKKIPLSLVYESYRGPNYIDLGDGVDNIENEEVLNQSSHFIQRRFLDIAGKKNQEIYSNFITATDSKQFEVIFRSIQDLTLSCNFLRRGFAGY
jgi:hypothetical protein